MKYLVTGAAGFIGMHVSQALLSRGDQVVGYDNLNDYYPVQLKRDRLSRLANQRDFRFIEGELANSGRLSQLFQAEKFDVVINLAAQAGVRYSLTNPGAYIESNLVGFANVLEACRHHDVKHFDVCFVKFSVWGEYDDAVLDPSQRGSSAQSLCCDEESQRADGAYL